MTLPTQALPQQPTVPSASAGTFSSSSTAQVPAGDDQRGFVRQLEQQVATLRLMGSMIDGLMPSQTGRAVDGGIGGSSAAHHADEPVEGGAHDLRRDEPKGTDDGQEMPGDVAATSDRTGLERSQTEIIQSHDSGPLNESVQAELVSSGQGSVSAERGRTSPRDSSDGTDQPSQRGGDRETSGPPKSVDPQPQNRTTEGASPLRAQNDTPQQAEAGSDRPGRPAATATAAAKAPPPSVNPGKTEAQAGVGKVAASQGASGGGARGGVQALRGLMSQGGMELGQGSGRAIKLVRSPARSAGTYAKDPSAFKAQLTRGLAAALRHKGGEVTLRLSPESLGSLKIKLLVEQGRVSARFEATTTQARQLLESHMHALKSALEARGLVPERFVVEHSEKAQTESHASQQRDAPGQRDAGGDGRSSQGRGETGWGGDGRDGGDRGGAGRWVRDAEASAWDQPASLVVDPAEPTIESMTQEAYVRIDAVA